MVASSVVVPKSGLYAEPRADWLASYSEEVIDPARRIIDAHHHLWDRQGGRYLLEELTDDIASGHNIVATVYVDCRSMYRANGPEAFKPVGEVEFANGVAAQSASGGYGKCAVNAAIVSHVNLQLGDDAKPVLEAQIKAGNGRYRGIRHSSAWDARSGRGRRLCGAAEGAACRSAVPKGFCLSRSARADVRRLAVSSADSGARRYCPRVSEPAHRHGPLRRPGRAWRLRGRRDEIFKTWKASVEDIAKCPNVVVKLGGLAMMLLGYDFHTRPKPVSSEELAKAWKPYMETCIAAFGPNRCMFESNFPPDKGQCSYQVIWNALKRIAAPYSEAEKNRMFEGTAAEVYKISL